MKDELLQKVVQEIAQNHRKRMDRRFFRPSTRFIPRARNIFRPLKKITPK